MDFGLQNIEDYTKDLNWMLKALSQLEKEFLVENWTFRRPVNPETAFEEIVLQLQPKLADLLEQRGDSYCKQLLYTIDLSESQVAKAASLEVDSNFSEVLTKLIIRRCLQKVLIRNYYKSPEKDALGSSLEE
jgi:hypothetical protein